MNKTALNFPFIQDLPDPVNVFLHAVRILLIRRQDKTADGSIILREAHLPASNQKKIDNRSYAAYILILMDLLSGKQEGIH